MKASLKFAVLVAVALPGAAAQAKTFFQDIHDFAGHAADGDSPFAELVADSQGRLYGTTLYGGDAGDGTIFRLTLPKNKTMQATIEILHSFEPGEGGYPEGGVLLGADGFIYGITSQGGAHNGGTVYRLDPTSFVLTTLHDFNSGAMPPDGSEPIAGLTPGPGGLLYGTTQSGGPSGGGTVFAISPRGDGVSYAVLHGFGATGDGKNPYLGRLVSSGNNLFGMTISDSTNGFGTAFQLTMSKAGTWTESVIHQFATIPNDVVRPANGLVLDKAGTLYGCGEGGANGQGAVFALTPASKGKGPWTDSIIESFGGTGAGEPAAAECAMVMDKSGRLIGTSSGGGTYGLGTVFTLTGGGGGWTLGVSYSFGPNSDGNPWEPTSALLSVAKDYYVGVTYMGGANGIGSAYRIKP